MGLSKPTYFMKLNHFTKFNDPKCFRSHHQSKLTFVLQEPTQKKVSCYSKIFFNLETKNCEERENGEKKEWCDICQGDPSL